MKKVFHALFLMLAQATQDELIRQIQYLKVENQILRSKLPKRVTVTPPERARLLKFGKLVMRGLYLSTLVKEPYFTD